MVSQKRVLLPVLIVLLALATPTHAKKGYLKEEPEQPDLSIVFGYFDMEDAPVNVKWVQMKRLRPKTDKPYYGFWVDKGLFYRASVPPGTYKFTSFGGHSNLKNASYTFDFPDQGRGDMDRVIKKQGVYFVGAYRYNKIKKTGMFRPGKFDLEPANSPTERELLLKLLEYAKHPAWKRLIDQRLKELSR